MSKAGTWTVRGLAVAGAAALLGAIGMAASGVSARPDPPGWETRLAGTARHLLIPRAARSAQNPLPATAEHLASARRHWADHCASCHGNDGKGETEIGRGLYPRAPDMTGEATQELSDGELFWIIENGVRLTGMPAWGGEEHGGSEESWELVHFVRRLPKLTPDELVEMKRFNPLTRAELEEELAAERFLAGEDVPKPRGEDAQHHH